MKQNEQNLEEAKAALQKQVEELKNKTYPDWDSMIIQLNQGDEVVLNIRMMRQDMDAMGELHGQDRKDFMELMVSTMEDQINNPAQPEKED